MTEGQGVDQGNQAQTQCEKAEPEHESNTQHQNYENPSITIEEFLIVEGT